MCSGDSFGSFPSPATNDLGRLGRSLPARWMHEGIHGAVPGRNMSEGSINNLLVRFTQEMDGLLGVAGMIIDS